jgi:hypothetical protein
MTRVGSEKAPIRAAHLAAGIMALVFMFLPAANDYFQHSWSAATPGSPTAAEAKQRTLM